ncbi:inactive polyglycylase TTLL10 isoform X1 [Pongo pygmaeus]|uniref:inactive polyglycylase TTLL10 isoform X1 n=2 Tax=Pongo pygmaeus TaxID=9600 RepID=UPI0023E2EB93|nr:inactive polyglycylase TTLL10 isoform X3 [Pongo pygmaeus]
MFKSLFCSSYQGAVSCRSFHLTSWHPGRAQPRLRSSSGWGGRARQRQGAETALPPHGARPHSCHGDGSQPHAQAQAHGPGRRPFLGRVDLTASSIQVLGPRAARSSHRRVRVASSLQGPRPGTPRPMAHSCTRFIHRRGPPTRTQAGSKRGKRPRIQRRPRAQVSGPAHKRPMGSSQEEGLPCQPSQPDHDAGGHCGPDLEGTERASATPGPPGLLNSHPPADSDDTNATRPSAALLEGLLLGGGKPSPHSTRPGPFFYIGGSNGATIISSYCKSKGWQRIQDSRRDDYTLKWCEVKSRDNYGSFREGEQLLYQLPNNKLLTTKIGLLSTLRGRARAMSQASKVLGGAQARLEKDTAAPALEDLPWTSPGYLRPQRVLRMEEFFPETYRLDLKHEREAFFTLFDETQIWICKPTASNQGKGIFLLRNQEEVAALQAKTRSMEDDPIHHKTPFRGPQARVVQRYIQNPLLLDGRKFDVRSYLLIACTTPYMIFFGHGYARLTLSLYDPRSSDLSGHLTNQDRPSGHSGSQSPGTVCPQFMQKKSPLYMLLKEDTVWSMEHLNRYINDTFWKARGLPKDWVFTTLTKRMQQIMAHCFLAAKPKLECKLGYFDLIGCDFLIDDNFKVWLLEMNSNPALHTNCEVLKEVIPGVVIETLDLVLETFRKSLRGQKMLPLLSQRRFVLLHNGEAELWPRLGGSCSLRRRLPPPTRQAKSSGPPTPHAPDQPGARRPAPPPLVPQCPRPPGPNLDSAHDGEPQAPGMEQSGACDRHPAQEPSPGTAKEEREEPKNARP